MFVWWTVACAPSGPPGGPHPAQDAPGLGNDEPAAATTLDLLPGDTAATDTGALDTGARHTGARHTGTAHTGTADTGTLHTGTLHTGVRDTGVRDTGVQDTATVPELVPPPVARLVVDVDEGDFPLMVSFDASGSDPGTGAVRYEWSFGDGESAVGDPRRVHTYVGRGDFDAELTLVDQASGLTSVAEVEIEVHRPRCPREDSPIAWGRLDRDLDAVSGIAASAIEPDLFWVQQDHDDDLAVVDRFGDTVSEHDLPNDWEDLEDIAIAVDRATGRSMLFVGDIGDNDARRSRVKVWIAEEPDPRTDSNLDPLELELTYPQEAHNAETLLVDPLTLDLYIVTKDPGGVDQRVFVKRAPHREGRFELTDRGSFDELDMTATGGSVSPDGSRVVVRDYSDNVRLWFRDGYERFEEAFDHEPCEIEIFDDSHGEGITFTRDGRGLVTSSEGAGVPLYCIEF